MLGHLIKQDSEWMVKYDNNGDIKLYPLCPESKKWANKDNIAKILKKDDEIVFDLVTSGRFSKSQDMIVKEFCGKIRYFDPKNIK
jgi:hypothetical protein